MKLPVLVECAPYNARLMEARCVDRWIKGQGVTDGKGLGQGQVAIANGTRRGVLHACITCEVGKRRATDASEQEASHAGRV